MILFKAAGWFLAMALLGMAANDWLWRRFWDAALCLVAALALVLMLTIKVA